MSIVRNVQTGLKGGLLRIIPLSIATQIVMILSFKIQIIMATKILTNYNDSQPNTALFTCDTQHCNKKIIMTFIIATQIIMAFRTERNNILTLSIATHTLSIMSQCLMTP